MIAAGLEAVAVVSAAPATSSRDAHAPARTGQAPRDHDQLLRAVGADLPRIELNRSLPPPLSAPMAHGNMRVRMYRCRSVMDIPRA